MNTNYKISDNNETSKDIWVFCPGAYMHTSVIQYIENLSDNSKKIIISNDINYINDINPHKIIFLLNPSRSELFERNSLDKFINKNFAFLQLEPLSLPCHSNHIIRYFNKYSYLKQYPIYDYSKTNIRILNKNGFNNCIHLPYNCQPSELDFLIKSNTKNKEYDFGYIYDWIQVNNGVKSFPIKPPRRNKVMEFLIKNGFTVNLIAGYGEDRDSELGKCKIILNIHGQINENPNPSPDECSNIFEHIRCDRLLKAGYTILSESSYDLDQDFIDKYPNLKIINYEDFFNINVINNIIYEFNIKNIYDTLCLNQNPFDYYLNPVDIHEHLPTLYKYATECNSILECGVRACISSWALAHGLLNNNRETKKLILNDISPCDISNLLERTKNIKNLNISYQWINDLDITLNKNVELTFIDTWHVGGHLKKELEKFSKLTNKYIIMHDTTIDEFTSEAIRANLSEEQIINLSHSSGLSVNDIKMGLWPAIEDFLKNNPEWALHERYTNNNGLTILKKKPSKKIVDCFTFYNELELLKYRLTILNDYVDYFVLVEATNTHVGKIKPLFYQENKELFKEFNHKIIHIIVDDFSHKYPNINIANNEQWINERFQRNCIKRGLDKLQLNDDDIFTVTDLDEIPDPKLLQKIKANEVIIDSNIIELDLYYYNLNCKIDHLWRLSKMISYKKYKELGFSCEQIRQNMSFEIIPNAGWHLSYFGNEQFIKNKIENFGHQEFNIEDFTNKNNILNRIKNQKDLYNRCGNSIINIEIKDNNYLPPKYDVYLKNFYTIKQDNLIEIYNYTNGSGVFIQIGAGAGDLDKRASYRDGFTEFIKSLPRNRIKKIILVEPNPLNIPLLRECWKNYPEAIIYEIGIIPKSITTNTIELYYCPLDAPNYQVASINKTHIYKHYGIGCELDKFTIQTKYLENFINETTREEIELLSLDIEGIDSEVILDLNFNNINIKFLSFEYIHLGDNEQNVLSHLKDNGFKYIGKGVDYNGYDYLYTK
jgi:beta-1,4-mannosyl-glycoprotein beta-1,4-N-acetylglucosaminyltransferase